MAKFFSIYKFRHNHIFMYLAKPEVLEIKTNMMMINSAYAVIITWQ